MRFCSSGNFVGRVVCVCAFACACACMVADMSRHMYIKDQEVLIRPWI